MLSSHIIHNLCKRSLAAVGVPYDVRKIHTKEPPSIVPLVPKRPSRMPSIASGGERSLCLLTLREELVVMAQGERWADLGGLARLVAFRHKPCAGHRSCPLKGHVSGSHAAGVEAGGAAGGV